MEIDKVMNIMREHGLYCVALTDKMIGLTDNAGNVYDVVIIDNDEQLIIDADTTMNLYNWLGY